MPWGQMYPFPQILAFVLQIVHFFISVVYFSASQECNALIFPPAPLFQISRKNERGVPFVGLSLYLRDST